MRAAMRCVLDGQQVALLAPTTVLAFQHWKTFRKRFAPFPVMVEMVSRFRRPREIKGRCGQCRQFDICGGNTRVRAMQVTGDPWEEDPACYLSDGEIDKYDAALQNFMTQRHMRTEYDQAGHERRAYYGPIQ